jgi:hypothetical protein
VGKSEVGNPGDNSAAWRFGDHRIDWVRLEGAHLYVKMEAGRHSAGLRRTERFIGQVWRIGLDGEGPAERADPPTKSIERTVEGEGFVQVDGSHLMVRESPLSPWVELTPETLLKQLQEATTDFFGGTGARWVP